MVKIIWTNGFERAFKKLKDRSLKERIIKQIEKTLKNPERGKPLRYNLKGERTIHINPYRLIYAFDKNRLILLRFLHRKKVYR